MGYREYAKDFEIEYVTVEGRRRPKMRRIYVGPYFRFQAEDRIIRRRRWQYPLLSALSAAALLIPMLVDCGLTRIWYIQVPGAAAWIPWLLAACAVWRLLTAKPLMDREHNDLTHDRMRGSAFFLMGLSGISTLGTAVWLAENAPTARDLLTGACYPAALFCGVCMFRLCRDLRTVTVENPEKPRAQKDA